MVGKTKDKLAIYGGRPVRKTLLPYGHQNINEDDVRIVTEVLNSDWITTGPKVDEFEKAFAEYVGSKYAVSFSSGTAALHSAANAAELKEGDEAITTPMTFCASANCILYQGAKPIFADVRADTLNINAELITERITPNTKAIIPVDYAGHPADMDSILGMAEKCGLTVVQDSCHSLGATYKGRRVGSISHMTVFSFHPVKHITTGEGGMVVTNNAEFCYRLVRFRNHGIESRARDRQAKGQWYYEMVSLGYNYRLSDIGCALGLSQLKRLETNLSHRREIASQYNEAFEKIQGIIRPTVEKEINAAWHLYPIRLDLSMFRADKAKIFSALRAENLGVNVHYIPVHLHPYYRQRFGYKRGDCPVAEQAYEQLISLPIFHGMGDQDVKDVIEAVRKVLSYYAR